MINLQKAIWLQVVAVSSPSLSLSPSRKAKQTNKNNVKSLVFRLASTGQNLDTHPQSRPVALSPPDPPRPLPVASLPSPILVISYHALVQVLDAEDWAPGLAPSSVHLSRLRRRAFMKKLLTVVSSSPSCCEMVSCISLDGRLFSLKIASKVRRCRSVKTSRDFFGVLLRSFAVSCSFLLHAAKENKGGKRFGREKGKGRMKKTKIYCLYFNNKAYKKD